MSANQQADKNADKHSELESKLKEELDQLSQQQDAADAENEALDKKFADAKKHPIIGLIIFTVLQFIALLFYVVATPIEMFTLNDEWTKRIYPEITEDKRICVTAWGLKLGCRTRSYYSRDYSTAFCFRVRVNFRVVEAFCIMNIAFMTFGFIFGFLSLFQKVAKNTAAAISILTTVTAMIPFCVLAGMYHQLPCCESTYEDDMLVSRDCTFERPINPSLFNEEVPRFKTMGKYGAGFGLIVTAFALQFVGSVFAVAPF